MKSLSKQKGIVLLLFVTVLATAAAAVTIKALNSTGTNNQIARDKITAAALAQAKDALIGYAITYGDTHPGNVHGYLPCPDQAGGNPEGSAEPSCGSQNVSQLGRLPWATLDLGPLRSGDGECLWYAVSGTYKNNSKTDLMNWDTNGQLQVYASDGTTLLTPADNQAVAVIFAPGSVAPGQNRTLTTNTSTCGDNYTATNYLDNDTVHGINNATISSVANAVTQFIAGPVKNTSGDVIVNDRLIVITKDDIFNAMLRRADFVDPARNPLRIMTQKATECLANYGNRNSVGSDDKRIPWASAISLSNYGSDASYNDIDGRLYGRLPYRVNTSDSATNNLIIYPYYQLQSNGLNCYPPASDWTNKYYPWWTNWKDQLFYVVAGAYQPDAGSSPSCGTCLSVNGSGSYIGIVIFSGRKIGSQARLTSSDKGSFSNYLESTNNTNFSASHSDGDHQFIGVNTNFMSTGETTSFNDVLYCINPDLTVVPCP